MCQGSSAWLFSRGSGETSLENQCSGRPLSRYTISGDTACRRAFHPLLLAVHVAIEEGKGGGWPFDLREVSSLRDNREAGVLEGCGIAGTVGGSGDAVALAPDDQDGD